MYRQKRESFISWSLLTWKQRATCLKTSGFSWNPKYFNFFLGKVVILWRCLGLLNSLMEPFTCAWKVLMYTKIGSGYSWFGLFLSDPIEYLSSQKKGGTCLGSCALRQGAWCNTASCNTKLVCSIQFNEHCLHQSLGNRHCGRQTLPPKCWEYNRRKKKKCMKGRCPLMCV